MDHDKPHFSGLTMQAALDEIMIKKKKSQIWGGVVQNGTFTSLLLKLLMPLIKLGGGDSRKKG